MTTPTAYVTDVYLSILNPDRFIADRAAHTALCEWVQFHGLDPAEVHACGPLHRDVDRCRVVYVGRDHDSAHPNVWTIRDQQGETPPMPWPPELDKYRVTP